MGQVLAVITSKFRGHQWRQTQLRKIADKVFENFKDDSERDYLLFEDLYMAVLFVYNDINKHFPGPHPDPPSKARVKSLMEAYDVNLDGQLNRDEFARFIQELTAEAFKTITKNLIAALVVAPTVALMTKRTTEGVPGIGKVVQGIPNSIYASVITFVVLMLGGTECQLTFFCMCLLVTVMSLPVCECKHYNSFSAKSVFHNPSYDHLLINPFSISIDHQPSQPSYGVPHQWQLAAFLTIVVNILAAPLPPATFYNAQFSKVAVFNQLGKGAIMQLSCYKLNITPTGADGHHLLLVPPTQI